MRLLSSIALAALLLASAASIVRAQSPTVYCTAKVNSLGCMPSIGFTGTPSASSTSGFTVSAERIRNGHRGLLFYSISGRASIPFRGGTLCVMTDIRRTPQQGSEGSPITVPDCSGQYSIDMNAFAAGLLGSHPLPELSLPGTTVNCQWWNRDRGSSFATGLTDALEYTVGS